MSKQVFLNVINREVEHIGRLSNVIGHMAFGLSARLEDTAPTVDCIADDSEQIAKLREWLIHNHLPFNDFTSSMTEGGADQQLAVTRMTKAQDLKYIGLRCCIPVNVLPNIMDPVEVINTAQATEVVGAAEAVYTAAGGCSASPSQNRFVAVVSKTLGVNALGVVENMASSLPKSISNLRPKLDEYIDADGGVHPYIPHDPFVVLSAKTSNQLDVLRTVLKEHNVVFTRATLPGDIDSKTVGICFYDVGNVLRDATKKFSVFNPTVHNIVELYEAGFIALGDQQALQQKIEFFPSLMEDSGGAETNLQEVYGYQNQEGSDLIGVVDEEEC